MTYDGRSQAEVFLGKQSTEELKDSIILINKIIRERSEKPKKIAFAVFEGNYNSKCFAEELYVEAAEYLLDLAKDNYKSRRLGNVEDAKAIKLEIRPLILDEHDYENCIDVRYKQENT